MVSISTRRLPSTWIEDTVWAAATDGTSKTANMATGMSNMIKAANKPPRTRIPKFMSKAALVIPLPARTPTNQQIPISCPACSQFCRGGKRPIAGQFHFHSKTLPIGHATQLKASRSGQMQDVVIGGKHHQHKHQAQPDPKP